MITLIHEEKYDLDGFLKKEKITLYKFAIMSGTPLSTLYSARDGKRRIRKTDFDRMMKKYLENKKSAQK